MNTTQNEMNINQENEISTLKQSKSKKARRVRNCLLLFLLVVVCFFCIGAVKMSLAPAIITVTAQDIEMKQEDEIPGFQIWVTADGNIDKKLDKEGYTVNSLLADLESGYGYHIESDVLAQEEGEYKLKVVLNSEIQEKLEGEWSKKLKVQLYDGEIRVQNKNGRWVDTIFMSWDNEPIISQWLESGGEIHYLDENGMMTTGEKQIGLTKYIFDEEGQVVSQEAYIDPNKPMVALTFDDGPRGHTDRLLDALEKYDAHATFYILGYSLKEEYRGTLQRMVELGCELGNHSKSHPSFTKLAPYQIQEEVNTTSEWIANYAGVYPATIRPPYGAVNQKVEESVSMPLILWSVDTLDWKTKDKDATVQAILEQSQDGSIVLMHDIHEWSVDAAIEAIPILQERGYQLVTVSEMAKARGIEMISGARYGSFYP